MANCIKLYYFAYLSVDNNFLRLILNAEEDGLNYRVISTEERPPPSSLIWRGKWKNRIVPKDDIDRLQGAFLYEMFCTENDPLLSLDLVERGFVTNQIVLTIGYDIENLTDKQISREYKGEVTTDRYGRKTPKHAHGTINLDKYTSSTNKLVAAAMELFDRIIDKRLTSRRINIVACRVIPEKEAVKENQFEQLDFFSNFEEKQADKEKEEKAFKREKSMQKAIIELKNRYGKNAEKI